MAEITTEMTNQESTVQFNQQELRDELDKLNRELDDMKETIMNTNVRAHVLEMELSTLYNPEVALSLQKLEETCESCRRSCDGDGTHVTADPVQPGSGSIAAEVGGDMAVM